MEVSIRKVDIKMRIMSVVTFYLIVEVTIAVRQCLLIGTQISLQVDWENDGIKNNFIYWRVLNATLTP